MNQSTLRSLKFIINPSESLELPIFCDYVRVKTSSVEVSISTREGDNFTLTEGEEANLGETRRVTFSHSSGIAQIIVLIFGINAKIGSAKTSGNMTVANAVEVFDTGMKYTNSFSSNTALAANVAQQVLAPATNVNGVIIRAANFTSEVASGLCAAALLAKRITAPASFTDGDPLLTPSMTALNVSRGVGASLGRSIKVAAGKGIYFISSTAEVWGSRSVIFDIL